MSSETQNERVAAAAKAWLNAKVTRGMDTTQRLRAALDAADAVMFNEDAVDRAARALCAAEFPDVAPAYAWNVQFEDGQNHYRQMARAAFAAVTGQAGQS